MNEIIPFDKAQIEALQKANARLENEIIPSYKAQIEALQKENERLNKEIQTIKTAALKLRCLDPIFDKPLADLEVNFQIVKPIK